MKSPTRRAVLGLAAGLMAMPLAFAQAPMKLTLGHNAGPGNPKAEAAIKFAEIVKAKSNGRLNVQVGAAAQLGDDLTMISALRTGTLDMSINSQGPLSSVLPELAALGLPFLFSSLPEAWKVLDGAVGQDLAKRLEPKNMILLGWMDNGIRQTTNNKRPVNVPADLQGMKLRTPADPATVDLFQAMGALTQQINFGELYVALQQGVVDGQENPLANIFSSKLYEVQKFLSFTNHKYECMPFVMSSITWARLSPADREIIKAAAVEATAYERKLMFESDEKLLGEFKKMSHLAINTPPSLAPFKAATEKVWDDWEKKPFGDFVKSLRATRGK
jgi:tripartite ATP-independent transporter DctP family solute receptor